LPTNNRATHVEFNSKSLFNATDLLNTMVIKQEIEGETFSYTSNNYYETQVIRLG